MKTILVAIAACMLFWIALFAMCMFTGGGSTVEHGWVSVNMGPDGKKVVFCSASGELFWFDLETREVSRFGGQPSEGSVPEFSVDGRVAVYSGPGDKPEQGAIYVFDMAKGETRRLTHQAGVSDSSPALSRDGRQVVFVRAARQRRFHGIGSLVWDDYDLFSVNLDGSGLTRLTHEKYYGMSSPGFTAGGRLLFSAMGHGDDLASAVYAVDPKGRGRPTPLMPKPTRRPMGGMGAWASDLAISPDGKRIAFISDRATSYSYDIYVANADGSDPRALGATKISAYNQQPRFAPDGQSLIFLAGTESNAGSRAIFSLWRIGLDGSAEQLADSGLFTDPLTWHGELGQATQGIPSTPSDPDQVQPPDL